MDIYSELDKVQKANPNSPPREPSWWRYMFLEDYRSGNDGLPLPFHANPFVAKPITADNYAQQMPVFLPGCTQFIVEYAGDFLDQENDGNSNFYGQVKNVYFELPWQLPAGSPLPADYVEPKTDGEIDYILDWTDSNNNGLIDSAAERASVKKRIRWYGLPRDVDGNGIILGGAAASNTVNSNFLKDVVPLRDVAYAASFSTVPELVAKARFRGLLRSPQMANSGAPFERIGPQRIVGKDAQSMAQEGVQSKNQTLRMLANYAAVGNPGMQPDDYYTCVWTYKDRKPSMFRITIVVDDPGGRLSDGQTFEYVFKVQ
jgi:hypothetical protein